MSSKNVGSGLVIQIGIKILTVFVGIFTARWSIQNIPENQLADLYTLIGLNAIVITIIFLGIPDLLHKFYTLQDEKEQNPAIWSTYQVLRISTFVIGLVIYLAALPFIKIDYSWLPVAVYTGAFIVVWDLNYKSITDALGHSWQFSVSDLISKIVFLATLILFQYVNFLNLSPVMYFATASLGSFVFAFIIDSVWQKPYIKWTKPDFSILQKNKQTIINLSLIGIVSAIYLYSDKLFLRFFHIEDVGVVSYSNAYRLVDIMFVLPLLVAPIVSSFVKKNIQSHSIQKYEEVCNKFFQNRGLEPLHTITFHGIGLLIFGLLVSVGVLIFAPLLIRLVDAQLLYPIAIPILVVLSSILSIVTCHYYLRFIMIFYHIEKLDLRNSIIIGVFTVILYIICIPTWGVFGAAIATVISYFADFILRAITVYRNIIQDKVVSTDY